MYHSNPYSLYKEQDLDTSSRYELVSKLYSAAAVNLKKAVTDIENKKLDMATDHIIRAQVIVKTLNDSLDLKYDISHQFRVLYVYMIKRIREANIEKDITILNEVSDMLVDFRNTWDEAVKNYKMLQSS